MKGIYMNNFFYDDTNTSTNINDPLKKHKAIYSYSLANILINKGCALVRVSRNIKRGKDRGIVFIFEDSPELNKYCNMFYELTGGLKKELVK